MMNDRLGKIKISKELLENFWKINVDFIPIQAAEEEDCFVYVCMSNQFRELSYGELVPSYELTYIKTKDGKVELSKVEELKCQFNAIIAKHQ